MALRIANPRAYDWDYDAGCKPGWSSRSSSQLTFSVGVFQWVPKLSGEGIKRAKVIKRFKGYMSNPEIVYTAAENYITNYLEKMSNV